MLWSGLCQPKPCSVIKLVKDPHQHWMWIQHHISPSSECWATEATVKVTVPVIKMLFKILLLDPVWQNNCTPGCRYTALTVKGMLAICQSQTLRALYHPLARNCARKASDRHCPIDTGEYFSILDRKKDVTKNFLGIQVSCPWPESLTFVHGQIFLLICSDSLFHSNN